MTTRLRLALIPGLILACHFPAQTANLGKLAVVGDSISAGMQNGVLLGCQQQRSYANLVANQAVAAGAVDSPLILPLVASPGFGPGSFAQRIQPPSQATNLSVPGQTVGQALAMRPFLPSEAYPAYPLYVPTVPEDGAQMMTNLVLGFPGVFATPPQALSQVEWANALDPDTIILWLGSNDAIGVYEGVQSKITDPLTFARNLDQALSALATKKRNIIIANIPDLTVLPAIQEALAGDAANTAQLKLTVAAYNAAISVLAAKYRATLVDIYSLVNNIQNNGIAVSGRPLTFDPYVGGLVSLDNIHPTDVMQAILANAFIDVINQQYHTKIQHADLAAVAATDPLFGWNPSQPLSLCATP